MAFTYNLSHSDATKQIVSQIRLRIGDTIRDRGPLPNGANLQDEEIDQLYSDEGSHVMRTVAACLELLATQWAAHAGSYRLGPESEESKASERYQQAAEKVRARYGYNLDATAQAQHGAFVAEVRPAGQA